MKKLKLILPVLVLLLLLSACGRTAPAAENPAPTQSPAEETSAPTPAPTDTPAPEADKSPVLSEGAALDAALSGLFQTGSDGTVYSAQIRAEGLVCLSDLLPGDTGYIAGFLRAEDGFYVSRKDAVFSLDPAALYFYPDEGDPRLITDNLHPGGLFCLSGGALYFETYEDGGLWRLDGTENEPRRVIQDEAWLLGADSGFIYYSRDGGVCRNDSTMQNEVRLFDDDGVTRLFAGPEGLCDLTYTGQTARLEFRAPDSVLRSAVDLDRAADSALCADGRIYVPGEAAILVYALDSGQSLDSLPLPEGQDYLTLHGIAAGSIYYEAFDGEAFHILRLPLDGGEPEDLGIAS